ncbi:MAG: GTPase Era [Clostridia bacterium]|nr:GTPase Era [Clostridia bacterium]
MKSAFIALIGRPNAGKSSILNRLVGEKVSIVSPKPQTTRDKIMGVVNGDDFQLVFTDTPGIHTPKNKLDAYMQKCVKQASEDVDGILVIVDAAKGISRWEIEIIEKALEGDADVFVAVNKTDIVKREDVFKILQQLAPLSARKDGIKDIFPVSAKNNVNMDILLGGLKSCLKDGVRYFPEDEYTDKPVRFVIGETIREKALLYLQDEIPHGVGVFVQKIDEGEVYSIEADIICEKESHKRIIIGEEGAMIKRISTSARADIERLVGRRVFIRLFVKVREDWRNRASYIKDIGYEN